MVTFVTESLSLWYFSISTVPDTSRLYGGSTPVPEHRYECHYFPHSRTTSDKYILMCFSISSWKKTTSRGKATLRDLCEPEPSAHVHGCWTYLRGVSSKPSSSSCSLSQSQGVFLFLFLHSHPCFRLTLVPSEMSSSPWEGDWNLLPKIPISFPLKKTKHTNVGQGCGSEVSTMSGINMLSGLEHQKDDLRLCFCIIVIKLITNKTIRPMADQHPLVMMMKESSIFWDFHVRMIIKSRISLI